MAKVLFRNVNVLDCTGAAPFAGQVLVEGNRIKAVAAQGAPVAGAARRLRNDAAPGGLMATARRD
jgi:hypothetical protein